MDLKHKIEKEIEPIVEKYGQELVDIELATDNRGQLIRVLVGSRKGPTVDDITKISREFLKIAEVKGTELIPYEFSLEVSSPGLTRPLKTTRDFLRNIDRDITIIVNFEEKNKTLTGTIKDADEEFVTIKEKNESKKIALKDIVKAKLVIKI